MAAANPNPPPDPSLFGLYHSGSPLSPVAAMAVPGSLIGAGQWLHSVDCSNISRPIQTLDDPPAPREAESIPRTQLIRPKLKKLRRIHGTAAQSAE